MPYAKTGYKNRHKIQVQYHYTVMKLYNGEELVTELGNLFHKAIVCGKQMRMIVGCGMTNGPV